MQQSLDVGVQSISKYGSRGTAIHLNKTRPKDLSAIMGRHKNTTAVFYVLQDLNDGEITSSQLQYQFWGQQYRAVYQAVDIGPIIIAPDINVLKFENLFENYEKLKSLNSWNPCI